MHVKVVHPHGHVGPELAAGRRGSAAGRELERPGAASSPPVAARRTNKAVHPRTECWRRARARDVRRPPSTSAPCTKTWPPVTTQRAAPASPTPRGPAKCRGALAASPVPCPFQLLLQTWTRMRAATLLPCAGGAPRHRRCRRRSGTAAPAPRRRHPRPPRRRRATARGGTCRCSP